MGGKRREARGGRQELEVGRVEDLPTGATGSSGGREGETISDVWVCVGVQGVLREGVRGANERRYVRFVSDFIISKTVGTADSSTLCEECRNPTWTLASSKIQKLPRGYTQGSWEVTRL